MQPSDKAAFVRTLMGLSAIKPGKELTTEALDLYWNAMQAWSIDDFKAAANQLARTSEFMPNPFHFEQLRKAGRPTSGEAWSHVLKFVRGGWTRWTDGSTSQMPGAIPPPDALIARAVDALGGYKAIAMSDEDKLPFLERRFADHYDAIRDADETRQAVPQIAVEARPQLSSETVQKLLDGVTEAVRQ